MALPQYLCKLPHIEVCSTYSNMNLFGGWSIFGVGGGEMGVVFSDFGLFLQFKEITALRRSAPGVSFSYQTLLISQRYFYSFPANGGKKLPVSFSSGTTAGEGTSPGVLLHSPSFSPHPQHAHLLRSYFFSLWLKLCLLLKVK